MRRTLARLFASSLPLACVAMAQGDVTRTGKTFVVTLHPGKTGEALAARLADDALAAAERVRPALEKLQLRPAKAPVIHVHVDERPFRALEAQASKLPYPIEGFMQAGAGQAHVLLWPRFDGIGLDFVGVSSPAAEEIMRQAVQLAAVERQPWLTADLWRARVLAHGVVDEIVNPGGAMGVDPLFDTRRFGHSYRAEQGKASPLRAWVEAIPAPAERSGFDYSESAMGLIAATLAAGGSLRKLVVVPTELDKGLAAARIATFEAMLGKDWAKNEARWRKMQSASKPCWSVESPMVARRDGRLLLVGTVDTPAVLQAVAPPAAGPYAVRATCELVPGWSDNLRVQLDWDTRSVLGCFLTADRVSIAGWEAGADKWDKDVASAKSPIQAGRPFEFSVEVDTKLRVVVDGARLLEVDYGKRSMHGQWSIATNEGPVWLANLRCEPLVPPQKK